MGIEPITSQLESTCSPFELMDLFVQLELESLIEFKGDVVSTSDTL